MKFQNYVVKKTGDSFKYIIVKKCGDRYFTGFRHKDTVPQEQLTIEKNIFEMKKYFKNYENQYDLSFSSMNLVIDKEDALEMNKRKTGSEEDKKRHGKEDNSVNKVKGFFTKKNELKTLKQADYDEIQKKIEKGKKEKKFDSELDSSSKSDDTIKSEKKKHVVLNLEKDNTLKKVEKNEISQGSTLYRAIRLSRIETFIHRKYKIKKRRKITSISFFSLLVIITINIYANHLRGPLQEKINSEIKEQTICPDIFSWVIWAQTHGVYNLDFLRAVYEGWIDDNLPKKDFNVTITSYAEPRLISSASYYAPDNILVKKIKNITFKEFAQYDKWINREVNAHFIERPIDKKEKKIVFQTIPISMRVLTKIMHVYSKNFVKRNYTSEKKNIPIMGDVNGRLNDPEEEFYRINNLGEYLLEYYRWSNEYTEYIVKLTRYGQDVIFLSFVIPIGVTAVFIGFLGVYYLLTVKKFRRFYRILLNFKVIFSLQFFYSKFYILKFLF